MADKKISITIEVDGVKQIVNNVEEAEKAMKGLGKETKKVAQENKFLGDAKQYIVSTVAICNILLLLLL